MPDFDKLSVELLLPSLARYFSERPGEPVFKFLGDSKTEAWTYGDLDRRSRAIAAALSQQVNPGERALLLYPQGLEFIAAFLGCLRAGVIAVPAYPPRKNRKAERLIGIVEDCTPAVVLTAEVVRKTLTNEVISFDGVRVIATDRLRDASDQFQAFEIEPETIAYLQYTSGSTGTPKGVIITHAALAWNINQIAHAVGVRSGWVVVSWLPMYHDMGLVGNVLSPAYLGGRAVLMAPSTFLQRPFTWLKAFSEERGTFSSCPNFGFDLCTRTITDEQKKMLDLSSIRLIVNAAEPVRADTIDRFVEAFGSCGFEPHKMFPCYGLAEATLFVTGGPYGAVPRQVQVDPETSEPIMRGTARRGRWLVGCGFPGMGSKVVAVDSESKSQLPDGEVGEIWVKSPALGSGYWGKLELSRNAFKNHLIDGDGSYLNTGDLGFVQDGEVIITGRSKDIIIVNGRNVYPQDVEAVVHTTFPSIGVNSCAAFGVEVGGQERLAVVVEADRETVRVARDVADYQVPRPSLIILWEYIDKLCIAILNEIEIALQSLTFVRPGTFLRTSSGKVQRGAVRAALLEGNLDVVFAWDARRPSCLSQAILFCP